MKLLTTNLADSLMAANRKRIAKEKSIIAHQQLLDAEIKKLIHDAKEEGQKMDAATLLGLNYEDTESGKMAKAHERWAHLDQSRIFREETIQKLCIRYSLRFLPTSYFKGQLDAAIPSKIDEFRKLNKGELPQTAPKFHHHSKFHHSRQSTEFFIAAPRESFKLTPRPKDPLLFVRLEGNTYYLIHKWGNDLSVLRRLMVMFSRTHEAIFIVPGVISALVSFGGFLAWMSVPSASARWMAIGLGVLASAIAGRLLSNMASKRFDTVSEWRSEYMNES